MILICDHRGRGLFEALRPLRGLGYQVEVARNLRETRECLRQERPRVLVVDPLVSGGSVELEELGELGGEPPGIPLLLVRDPGDSEGLQRSAAALSTRVWDLIRRDACIEEFALRVQKLLGRRAEVLELTQLRYRAAHDDLTELLRPLYFQARLEEHYSAATRHGLDLSLVLVDLDDFGQVNKMFDHTVGDRVLGYVAHVIRESLRAEDVAGRIGGDEFAIVLPFTGALEAAATVRRMCEMIRALSGTVDGTTVHLPISASLGFETTDGRDLDSVETLRRHAESALRRAKRAGGDRGVYYRSRPEGTG
jgi:diguanylate cyclase (GGDEF)-like protein